MQLLKSFGHIVQYFCRISYSFYYGKKISIRCGFSQKGFLPISKQLITVDQKIFQIFVLSCPSTLSLFFSITWLRRIMIQNLQFLTASLHQTVTKNQIRTNQFGCLIFFKSCHLKREEFKGLSFKCSGNYIVAPIFCFLRQILQILATGLFFYFAELCKV